MGMLLYRHRLDVGVSENITKAEDVQPSVATPVIEEVAEKEEVTYTRTQINRMSTADLQKLAKAEGLDDTLSGAKLKELLIKHFGV